MNIRTITAGAREEEIERVAQAALSAREALRNAGYTVQTMRLSLLTSGSNRCADFVTVARGVEERALEAGFDMVSLGRIDAERIEQVPDAIAATQNVSMSVKIAGRNGLADPSAIRAAAQTMIDISKKTPEGFGNFRFAALGCVAPGSPFFPASYHMGGVPWLAIGPEAATLAVQATAVTGGDGDQEATRPLRGLSGAADFARPIPHSIPRLTALIERHDQVIKAALSRIEPEFGVYVSGCDWSLAPSPERACSIGVAIEALTGAPFGTWGTLTAVRALTESIQQARVNRIGFSGVMLPVLEDTVLAERARATPAYYGVRDLLAFSAVCGTGLDLIPLAGDISVNQVARVLGEVAALAGAWRKPLTARLLPLPGRNAGESTAIDFERFPELAGFLRQTRVMDAI